MLNTMFNADLLALALFHLPGFYEPFSAISHLLGALVFLILGIILLRRSRAHRGRLIALSIYAFSCVLLMSMSGVYHMMERGGTAHSVMARLDHAAIFLLIAGTFTPTHAILFRGWRRWVPLAFIWTAAINAIVFRTIFFDSIAPWLNLTLYLTLGWFGAISAIFVVQAYGWRYVRPLAWGALAYTLGGVTEFASWPILIPRVIEGHEVFHVAVLIGAFYHWKFVAQFAVPEVRPESLTKPHRPWAGHWHRTSLN